MSTISVRNITGKDGQPVNFPNGIRIAAGTSGGINDIGVMGNLGFGVGICPGPLPAGMVEMAGTRDPASDNYGNYQFSDGSVCVWVPAFYMKWGTGANGLAINAIDVKPFSAYASVSAANTAGYSLPRAFYNAGAIQQGFFIDKYECSKNGTVASSIRGGTPLSTNSANNPISDLTGAPSNSLGGCIAAAQTRGSLWHVAFHDYRYALACLSYAHGQAATGSIWCAWYDGARVTNYPKGNNNALSDIADTTLRFTATAYDPGTSSRPALSGSANFFARTTHNGQNCGVADINGNMWECSPGLTSDGTSYYVLKATVDKRLLTGGNTLSTDLFGATGIAANYDLLGATYGPLQARASHQRVGRAEQTFSEATSGLAWQAANAGLPIDTNTTGTNAFGADLLYDARPNELCPIASGNCSNEANAGVWCVYCNNPRATSNASIGFRAAALLP